jgi:ribonuclease HII
VILDPAQPIAGLADSKTLSPARRERMAAEIEARALAFAVAAASVGEIDTHNILQATMLAMSRAVAALPLRPTAAIIDGNRCPALPVPAHAIVRGDALEPAISAASILAKVGRDGEMRRLHETYPHYGFDRHKGYPTAEHILALEIHGPSPIHRLSFAPVARLLKCR